MSFEGFPFALSRPKSDLLRLALVAATALGTTACAFEASPRSDDENVDSGSRPIVGGTKATAYPEGVLLDMLQNEHAVGACSGALVAPRVVLTAGHCVFGFSGWTAVAPFVSGTKVRASSGATYDWKSTSQVVDPRMHDVGLVFLDAPVSLSSYPSISTTKLANGAKVVNVGRIQTGSFSSTALFVGAPVSVNDAASRGFPFDYVGVEVIESGDSGGPVFVPETHTIVAVNSGAGGNTEILARVDLVSSWIEQQIAAHGGGGTSTPPAGSAGEPSRCGDVTFAGKCSDNSVVWCDGGLHELACATGCGLDPKKGYYDCL